MEQPILNIQSNPQVSKLQTFLKIVSKGCTILYIIYVITLLFWSSALRTTHRNFLSVIQKLIQTQIKVPDELYGAISGPIFSFFHATSGLIFGRLADIYPRNYLLVFSIISWTTFTCLHGLITKWWHLIIVRIGLAICMSGVPSISMSLISDYVPTKYRTLAVSYYNVSFIIAVAGPYFFGLFVDEKTQNWRTLYFIMGIPGFVLAALVFFTLEEPERGKKDEIKTNTKSTLWESIRFIMKCPSLWLICFISGFAFMGANSTNVWGTAFYTRVYGVEVKEISKWLTWISPIAGFIGTFGGGFLADRLQSYTDRGYPILCVLVMLFSIPVQIVAFLSPTFMLSIILSFPSFLFGFAIVPVMYMIPIIVVPSSMRSLSVSWVMLWLGGVGSLGPMLVGFLNGLNIPYFDMKPNNLSIRGSLLFVWSICNIFVFILFFIMIFTLPRDLRIIRELNQEQQKDN